MKWALLVPAVLAGICAISPVLAADHPGQKFFVSPDNLPRPYATPATASQSEPMPRPKGKLPEVPQGFQISLYAGNLTNARWMAVAPNGDVFLAEPKAGRVTLLRDSNGDGRADITTTFIAGFEQPHGLAVAGGYLYVSDVLGLWRVPYRDGDMMASAAAQKVTKAVDLRPRGNHWTRDFAIAPDGAIYLGFGSRDNVSDYKPGAQVMKIDATGAMSEFAGGIRNPVGLAFYPGSDTLYVSVNERDGLGDGLPPDYFTSVKPGGFYGYPYAYTGTHPDPDWGSKKPDMVARSITPDVLFQAHSAPTGLAFYTGANFPAEYKNDAFVSLHGSWNAGQPTGYKVVRVHFQNGKPQGGYENFVTGFWDGTGGGGTPQKVMGRPAGLAVAKDGSLLIADDGANVIWRVTYTGR